MNKTALITGGSHNIGQGIAIVLAEHGYDVAITYNSRKEGAIETQQEIEKLGRKCFIYQASLEKAEVPQQIVDQAHKDLGRLDLMVCNAGNGGFRGSILTITPENVDEVYTVNFRNYMLCAGAAARHMVADKIEGNIIFITSSRAEIFSLPSSTDIAISAPDSLIRIARLRSSMSGQEKAALTSCTADATGFTSACARTTKNSANAPL